MNKAIEIYYNCKSLIDDECKNLLYLNGKDQPFRRQSLNDLLDSLIRQVNHHALQDVITEKRAKQLINWLTNYTIKRHDK